jgi:hypothetical protein
MADLLNQFTNSMPGASGPSSPQSSYPSSNMAANNTFGSYANPSYEQSGLSTLNGAGGSSSALPLEGQYGIVKMASGGRVGLRSVAKELQDMGRGGDTILAHINPQEAALLKRMGGSGTINPATGLPEFLKIGKVFKPVTNVLKGVEKAVVRPIGDVLKPILPYVQYVAPFIPGVGPLAAAGLGALGSGFAGGGGFNFKRGLMGGMTAYGLSNLYAGMQAAGGAPGMSPTGTEIGAPSVADVSANLGVEGAVATAPGSQSAMLAEQAAGFGDAGLSNIASSASYATPVPTELGLAGGDAFGRVANTGLTEPTIADMPFTDRAGAYLSNMGDRVGTQMSDAGQGIKNLVGVGDTTMSAADAAKAFTGSGATMTNTAGAGFMGYTGGAAIEEAEQAQLQADLANAKSQEEYNAIMARIEASRQRGIAAMRANPYQFAYGGPVDDEPGLDDWNNYAGGGIGMAKGGTTPRFLSGGGDGMSDDIPAVIAGKQPARLADGEFVIPADVVSHLGNGSSKAGAKQLYSMMDKVRTARTGNKKQGKQINPAKYMPA